MNIIQENMETETEKKKQPPSLLPKQIKQSVKLVPKSRANWKN